jgi:hypothetical protein
MAVKIKEKFRFFRVKSSNLSNQVEDANDFREGLLLSAEFFKIPVSIVVIASKTSSVVTQDYSIDTYHRDYYPHDG